MPLSLTELQKAQAESEGFQQGPTPALNNANLSTQSKLGNPQTPSTSPAPYYPSQETPNLKLSTRDMASELANNFVILDASISVGSLSFPAVSHEWLNSYNAVTGLFTAVQPTFTDLLAHPTTLAGYGITDALPSSTVLPATDAGSSHHFLTSYTASTGAFTDAQPSFADISGSLALGQIPAGGSGTTFLRGDGAWATPSSGSASSLTLSPVNLLSGGTDAIPPHTAATYMVTTAGVNAMTLAAPTVTTDDGIVIKVTLSTNAAHTITCTGGTLRPGTAAVTTINFASFRGSSIELMAWQGNWYVMAQNNIASYT
jgi:hypothetical protein